MNVSLFRQQALDAKVSQLAGNIILARPISIRLAALVSGCIMLALGIFVSCGEYTRKVRVPGQIVPATGAIRVVASQFGRITTRHVHEGDTVERGQVMFELSNERMGASGGVERRINLSLSARRVELAEERKLQIAQLTQRGQALQLRERLIEAEIITKQEEVVLQNTQIESARETLKSYSKLRQKGFISAAQLRQVRTDLNAQMARRKSLEGVVLASRRDLLQTQEDALIIAGQIKLIESQSSRNLALLEQEAAEHDGRTQSHVIAPATGVVTALIHDPGQTVSAGANLATILPAGIELEAHLMVPSRAIGFVEPGQRVLLRLTSFAYQKFGQVPGTVARVERSPIGEVQSVSAVEPTYRVTIKLAQQSVIAYGRKQHFKAGMTLDADILQDRRRLIEWVIDPLISAAKGRAG